MNFINLIADVAVPIYDAPKPNMVEKIGVIVIISSLVVGVLAIIAVLVARMIRRNNINNNNAQGLYGPPSMFNKRKEAEPPEDLYGCPRPDEMDEEPDSAIESENENNEED